MHRTLAALIGLAVLIGVAPPAPAAPLALTATVEWTILGPSPPGPARTLLLPIDTAGIGPIEHPDCAVWDAATHRLTIYDTATTDRAACTPAAKTIRRAVPGADVYALTWPEGAGPFWEYLLEPGDALAVTPQPDGGLRVQLP